MSILRPEGVPERAEALDWFKHYRSRKEPSKLAPGAEQLIPELVCPRCQAVEDAPRYGKTSMCMRCGLQRQWAAGYIFAWDEPKAESLA